jgi:hypothetical protein
MRGNFKRKRLKVVDPSPEALLVFNQIKEIIKPHLDYFEVSIDTADEFEAVTKNVIRINHGNFRTAATQISFVLVRINQHHVRLQFHPLYLEPKLIDTLSSELQSLKAKAITFHFTTLTPKLETDVNQLIEQGIKVYKERKYIR